MRKRPHVNDLLNHIPDDCEVIVFTTGMTNYAEVMIPLLFKDHFEKHMRRNRTLHFKILAKPHALEPGKPIACMRPLASSILIDDSESNAIQTEKNNHIWIPKWKGDDPNDEALNVIALRFFPHFVKADDVRKVPKSR